MDSNRRAGSKASVAVARTLAVEVASDLDREVRARDE